MAKGAQAIILLTPVAMSLIYKLIALDFSWTMIQNVLNNGNDTYRQLFLKSVRYMLFVWVVKNFKKIIESLLNSFVEIGRIAGGSSLSIQDVSDPSYIIDVGYKLMDKMYTFKDLVQGGGPDSVGVQGIVNSVILMAKGDLTVAKLFPNVFFFMVSSLIFVAFALIALQLFITWVETYFVTSVAIIFIPCAVFKPFAFIAEKAIGACVGAAIKLLMLVFILSVSVPILETWTIDANPTTYESLKLLVSAAAIAFLCWQAPAMAMSLMSGTPTLTAGSMFTGMMAGASFTSAMVQATRLGVETAFKSMESVKQMAAAGSGISTPGQLIQQATAGGGLSGQDGVFNTGQYGTADGGATASGQGSTMSAASVAERVDPSLASREPGGSNTSSSGAAAANTSSSNSDQASSTSTASDASPTASVSNTGGANQDNTMSAANIAERIRLSDKGV
jgi:P-type conjugative transfer protein TrbL